MFFSYEKTEKIFFSDKSYVLIKLVFTVLVVKILVQCFNPIESYEEKTIFDEFQKFRRALTEIAVTFPKLKILLQKFGF
jgi:hypothetical protein